MARTTTWPLRVSGRGGMSIRADSSKGDADACARGERGQSAVRCRRERQKVSGNREWESGNGPPHDGLPGSDTRHPNQNVWSGPVSRILFPRRSEDEDHSSATRVAAVVKQPTRKLITETGGSMTSLFGLAPQGVCRAAPTRVGRGALLPHRFTLTSSSNTLRCPRRSAVYSLLHFPSRRRAWPLASLLPVRVRTFLDA
jgi:hypothetical protein